MNVVSLIGFAVATTITPGPNNIMVAASAARHGLRATVPHVLGIAAGFVLMLFIVCAGLASLLAGLPTVWIVLRWLGLAWLLYLAWKIANAGAPGEGRARPPLGFLGGAAFQWINPKAWLMSVTAAATFLESDRPALPQAALVAGVFLCVALPCLLPWALLGRAAAPWLRKPGRMRAFNITMAMLLVASVAPLAVDHPAP